MFSYLQKIPDTATIRETCFSQEAIPRKPWLGAWKAVTVYKCMQYDHYTPPGQDMVSGK